MEKEESLQVEVIQHKEDNKQETPFKLLMLPHEFVISSCETEETEFKGTLKDPIVSNQRVDNNCESTSVSELEPVDILTCQQHFKASKASTSLFSCKEPSKPSLLSIEDDDFMTELTPFNDLVVTNNLKSNNEYLPYYRTYTNLLETNLDANMDLKQENVEGEGIQNNGCIFHPQYEEEPLKAMDFATGYFPYYRSCEEFFGTSDLPCEAYSSIDSEEVDLSSTEELESVIDCEIEEVYEDTIIQESSETNENSSQDSESFKLPKDHVFTNSIIESCDSETSSSFNEIISLNEPSSSSGYFPFYRTYEKIILSPESSLKMFSSSEEAIVEFGLQMEGTGEPGDYSNLGCSVC